jgi:AhpD family alkylhydroperoxidase
MAGRLLRPAKNAGLATTQGKELRLCKHPAQAPAGLACWLEKCDNHVSGIILIIRSKPMPTMPKNYRRLQQEHPNLYAAYETLGKTAAESGPLEQKTRELIKLGMSAARGSESAVHSHTHRALQAGATPDEIEHAILLGINTLGFASMMAALSWARDAIEGHQDG